jgi:hypothetical protein
MDRLGNSELNSMNNEDFNEKVESDNDPTERIIGLNELIEELMGDAKSLSEDLIEGIGAVGGAAAIMFTIVFVEGILLITNLWRGPLFIAALFLTGMLPLLIISTRLLLKYYELRTRYSRIYEIIKELKK